LRSSKRSTKRSSERTIYSDLLAAARAVLSNAYSPYSKFSVAAAVLLGDGSVVTGVNVENASYGLTICAERVAIFRAIAEGRRDIKAIAIVSGSSDRCYPCGACRQVLAEFADDKAVVIVEDRRGKPLVFKADKLLPSSFGSSDLPNS
jgi:cytidine deaminase